MITRACARWALGRVWLRAARCVGRAAPARLALHGAPAVLRGASRLWGRWLRSALSAHPSACLPPASRCTSHQVADRHNAILLSDMAHISGLVAAGVVPSPFGARTPPHQPWLALAAQHPRAAWLALLRCRRAQLEAAQPPPHSMRRNLTRHTNTPPLPPSTQPHAL